MLEIQIGNRAPMFNKNSKYRKALLGNLNFCRIQQNMLIFMENRILVNIKNVQVIEDNVF